MYFPSLSASSTPAHALLICGMHRGGVSVLARLLELLGARWPGQPATASRDLPYLHNRLLNEVGLDWDDIRGLSVGPRRPPYADKVRNDLLDRLREACTDTPLFMVCDPRISRLAWLWQDVLADFGAKPAFVIAVRHPLEVAAAMAQRDGFPQAKTLLLWLRHMLEAERDTRGAHRCFVAYDALLADWRNEVKRMAATLKLDWPVPPAAGQASAIDGMVSPAHRHHHFSAADLDRAAGVPRWVKQVHGALRAACTGDETQLPKLFDKVHRELNAGERTFGAMIDHNAIGAAPLPRTEPPAPPAAPVSGHTVRVVAQSARLPKFSIIVPHYEDWVPAEQFQRGMACLRDQTCRDFEVILLHDGPKRRPFAEDVDLRACQVGKTIVTDQRCNDWGHTLRDIGMREARGEYILHFNPDNILYPHALARIDDCLRQPWPAPASGDGKPASPVGDDIVIFPIVMRGTVCCGRGVIRTRQDEAHHAFVLTGYPARHLHIDCMQMVMRRSLWLDHGGWSDRRPHSDGILYPGFIERHGARHVGEILGEHW